MKVERFQDFDAFVESVDGVDCVMLPRNIQQRLWCNTHLNVGELVVQLGTLGSGNIVEGQSFSSGYLIYLPLTSDASYVANGQLLDVNSFAILEPGCEFSICTEDLHDWCAVVVPTQLFNQWESDLTTQNRGVRVTLPMPEPAKQFRALVQDIISATSVCPEFETSPAATAVAADFLKLAGVIVQEPALGAGDIHGGRPRIPRDEIVLRSKDVIKHNLGSPLLAEQLATMVGVSGRTLRNAFHEYYGFGPASYLRLRRLDQIHRELRAADAEETTVSRVLATNGIWEFGRFASLYRRYFGELPSDTLRAKAHDNSLWSSIQNR